MDLCIKLRIKARGAIITLISILVGAYLQNNRGTVTARRCGLDQTTKTRTPPDLYATVMDQNVELYDNFLDKPDLVRHIALGLSYTHIQKSVPGRMKFCCLLMVDYDFSIEEKVPKIF